MSVMKFDKTPTPLEEVIKINEIIDNLGLGGGVGIRREEFTSSDWVEQQNGKYRYTIYGIKDVISVYRLYNGDYAFVGCDITNDDDNAYIDSPNAFDGFAYVASQEEVLGNRNIGAIIKSLIPQNDAGLHLLDGSLIQGNGIYEEFVNYMAELYGDGTNIPHYFTSESDWQNEVTTYGCCGKFVYDSENNTVRLPKFERILQGTLLESELGDRIEAGAPNITGSVNFSRCEINGTDGAFRLTEARTAIGANSDRPTGLVSFDASRSNPIYGNSDTIQPPAIKVLYYIVIATATKTDIKVDIDEITTDLNGKADVDLSNINASQTAKKTIVGWGMPSGTYIDFNISNDYVAPADGYFLMQGQATAADGWCNVLVKENTTSSALLHISTVGPNNGHGTAASLPIRKGQIFHHDSLNYSISVIRFVYAEGEI